MENATTRREMLTRTGRVLAGTAAAVLSPVRLQAAINGANERVNLGLVGCGQRGMELAGLLLRRKDIALPMVCDVDAKRAELAADRIAKERPSKPKTSGDIRSLLDNREINGLIIASPDHWHCLHVLYACLAEKDIYVEAPLCHTVLEGMAMVQAVRKYHRVAQVGMQLRAATWFDEAVQRIHSGKLGRIAQTRSWTFMKADALAPQPDGKPPAHLDYDRWVGPAPMRDYNPARSHGRFYNWWDYGGGVITRWNVHLQDVIHRALKINAPKSIVAAGGNDGLKDFRETPDTFEVVFEYDSDIGGLKRETFMHIYSLRMNNGHAAWGPPIPRHTLEAGPGTSMHWGVQFHGNDATLFLDHNRMAVFSTESQQTQTLDELEPPGASATTDALTLAHLEDFVDCIRTRNEPKAQIEAGHSAVLACHLANIAYRTGKRVYYDANSLKCFTDPQHSIPHQEADDLLYRLYRDAYMPPSF